MPNSINPAWELQVSDILPFVSVVLPIRNEGRNIVRCLNAILAQDYPADRLEILIADGMSTDGTPAIIQQVSKKSSKHTVHLIENTEQNFSHGFNIAVSQSKGEIILMLGGHTELAPDYISRGVTHLQSPIIDCVGGVLETIANDPVGQAIAVGMSSPFGVGGVAFRTTESTDGILEVDTAAFGAYKRDVFKQNGLLDEEMVRNQDDEFNYRIRSFGCHIYLAHDMRLKYYSRVTFRALWRQYFQYGYWKVRVLQKHPRQMRLRQFVPPAFVVALFVSVLVAFPPVLRNLSFVLPLFYLLVNLLASIYTAYKRGWDYLLLLPLVFAILHLSYGSGFLVGLFKFVGRWGDRIGKVPSYHPILD